MKMRRLQTDDRGQVRPKMVAVTMVALVSFALMAAFLLPVALSEIEAGNTTVTETIDVGNTVAINAELNATLDSATAGSPDTATITLNDTRTAGTTQNTIDNGSSADYALDGGTVTVAVTDVNGGTNATADYTYPIDFAFGSGASAIWGVIGLAIILGAFIMALGIGMKVMEQM